MKKKNPNNFSLSVLLTGVLGCAGLAFLLYFLITGTIGHNDGRLNLASENISYLAEVGHMDSITDEEASTIKSDVQENINEKMNSLELEPNVDYAVNQLDDIEAGIRLDSVNITVTAVKSSTKVKGQLVVELNGQEDISDRSNDSLATINVPTNQQNSLSSVRANIIKLAITTNVSNILSKGQVTGEGVDYEINGLNFIIAGAAFTDYNGKVTVNAISSSNKLKGSFIINFQLSDS